MWNQLTAKSYTGNAKCTHSAAEALVKHLSCLSEKHVTLHFFIKHLCSLLSSMHINSNLVLKDVASEIDSANKV